MENKWYTSSTGQGVSLTLKGLILGLIPTIIFIANYYHVTITQDQIVQAVDQITIGLSAIAFLYGLARKAYYKIKQFRNQ